MVRAVLGQGESDAEAIDDFRGLSRRRPLLALTMGDPAGVGPELCLRALSAPPGGARLALFGDWGVLERVAAAASAPLPMDAEVVPLPFYRRGT